jgi:drug/metabolite transporter (DMT)-like permease
MLLCLATVYVVWGTSYVATRVGVTALPPFLFGGLRFFMSGTLLLTIGFWRGFRVQQLRGQWRHLVVISLLGVAICNGLQVWAMQWVPSNTSALLNASCALWIVVFGLFGARAHRPGARDITGLLIGFVGTLLLMTPAHGAGAISTPLLPQLALVSGCVVWSLATIYVRNFGMQLDLFAMVGLQMLLGGAMMLVFALLLHEPALWQWSRPGLLAMGYLVLVSSCCAYTAYTWLARHATPAQISTYSYVNPAIAAVAGYLALNERMSGMQVIGAAVILAGVLLINWPVKSTAP